jgi:hypothetical protein
VETWQDLRWFVVFNGIADAWLWGFDADGWRLRHGDPAMGALGILPQPGGQVATLDDAWWLADVLAYDHDAPVGVAPAWDGVFPSAVPRDRAAAPPLQPIHQLAEGQMDAWYWQSLAQAYGAVADLRFANSYVLRYDGEDGDPGTRFQERFAGKEELVGLYAMAARQADVLAEYLCLYRVLEAADGRNGKVFISGAVQSLASQDFGELWVIGGDLTFESAENAFATYQTRALQEIAALRQQGVADVSDHLYRLRNSLAHGKKDVLSSPRSQRFELAVRALPIVKLLARMAVEP